MVTKTNIEKLKRFCEGHACETDKQYIYSLFSENESNLKFQQHFKVDFIEYMKNHADEEENLNYILDRINYIIDRDFGKKKSIFLRNVIRWYSAIAAVFLKPLLIAGTIWHSSQRDEENTLLLQVHVTNTLFALHE